MIPFLAGAFPWRLFAYCITAFTVLSLIAGGYAYVTRLQNRVVQLEVALAAEQSAHQITTESIDQLKRTIVLNKQQVDQLRQKNLEDQESWIATLKLIDDLDDCPAPPTPETIKPSPKSPHDQVDRLNRTNSDVNRMLERIGK